MQIGGDTKYTSNTWSVQWANRPSLLPFNQVSEPDQAERMVHRIILSQTPTAFLCPWARYPSPWLKKSSLLAARTSVAMQGKLRCMEVAPSASSAHSPVGEWLLPLENSGAAPMRAALLQTGAPPLIEDSGQTLQVRRFAFLLQDSLSRTE